MNPITSVSGLSSLPGSGAAAPSSTTGPSGSGFGGMLANAVDGLSGLQNTANSAAIQAVTTGDLTDIHQATLAATRAQVTMELVTAVRNKGIDAFNQIMSMQA